MRHAPRRAGGALHAMHWLPAVRRAVLIVLTKYDGELSYLPTVPTLPLPLPLPCLQYPRPYTTPRSGGKHVCVGLCCVCGWECGYVSVGGVHVCAGGCVGWVGTRAGCIPCGSARSGGRAVGVAGVAGQPGSRLMVGAGAVPVYATHNRGHSTKALRTQSQGISPHCTTCRDGHVQQHFTDSLINAIMKAFNKGA